MREREITPRDIEQRLDALGFALGTASPSEPPAALVKAVRRRRARILFERAGATAFALALLTVVGLIAAESGRAQETGTPTLAAPGPVTVGTGLGIGAAGNVASLVPAQGGSATAEPLRVRDLGRVLMDDARLLDLSDR